jgi:hypothetical protein
MSRFADPDNWVLVLHGYRSDRNGLHLRRRFFARRGGTPPLKLPSK